MSLPHPSFKRFAVSDQVNYFKNDRLYFLWLIFSAYYFIPVFVIPITGWKLVLALIGYAAFITTYISVRFLPEKHWHLAVAVMLGIATACSLINPGASNFYMYTGFFLGVMLPIGYFIGAVSLLLIGTYFLGEALNYPFLFFSLYILIGAPTIGMIGVVERMRAHNARREQQSAEEIRSLAQSLERERIARDLHDVIGHTLSTITLKAELARKLLAREQTDKSLRELDELLLIARSGLQQVRETISEVGQQSLSDTLTQIRERIQARGLTVEMDEPPASLDKTCEYALSLILTELATNILRHSRANRCEFRFTHTANTWEIRVIDHNPTDNLVEGNGLSGIRQRVAALGGTLTITTGEQLCIHITLPQEAPL